MLLLAAFRRSNHSLKNTKFGATLEGSLVRNLPLYQRTRGSPHCVTRCTEHLAGPVRTREAEACSPQAGVRCAVPY